jgi:putative SOS response-associated peptidase YedK
VIERSIRLGLTTGDPPRYNIAPDQHAAVVTSTREVSMRWGLLAPWRGHGGKRGPMIVLARRENIARTPLIRNAFKKQRVAIRADGFYAWRKIGKKSQPYWIHAPGEIAFAGVWAMHKDDGVDSFALLIGPANALVAPIDAEMPFVVDRDWVDAPAEDALARLVSWDPAGWRADAVTTWVNAVDHDDEKCIEILGNAAQGELF